jgi:hypothetical protein
MYIVAGVSEGGGEVGERSNDGEYDYVLSNLAFKLQIPLV